MRYSIRVSSQRYWARKYWFMRAFTTSQKRYRKRKHDWMFKLNSRVTRIDLSISRISAFEYALSVMNTKSLSSGT